MGQRMARKRRNLTGSRSRSPDTSVVWNIDNVEKDEMKSDERPTKLSGRDSDRVGREGNDRDAETSCQCQDTKIRDRRLHTASQTRKVCANSRHSDTEIGGCEVDIHMRCRRRRMCKDD